MSKENRLDLDAVRRQVTTVRQVEAWLPLEVIRVLELAPLMLAEIEELRAEARS